MIQIKSPSVWFFYIFFLTSQQHCSPSKSNTQNEPVFSSEDPPNINNHADPSDENTSENVSTIPNPCDNDPCSNNASCQPSLNNDDFLCLCEPGYTGSLCETNIDECAGQPCLNSGVCTDGILGFSCQCPTDFSGPLCALETPSLPQPKKPLSPTARRMDVFFEGQIRPWTDPQTAPSFTQTIPTDTDKTITLSETSSSHMIQYADFSLAPNNLSHMFVEFQESGNATAALKYGVSLFRNDVLTAYTEHENVYLSRKNIEEGVRVEILTTEPRRLRVVTPDNVVQEEHTVTLNDRWNLLTMRIGNGHMAVWLNNTPVVSDIPLTNYTLGSSHGIYAITQGRGFSLQARNIHIKENNTWISQETPPSPSWMFLASAVETATLPSYEEVSFATIQISEFQICSKLHRDRDAYVAINSVREACSAYPSQPNPDTLDPNSTEPQGTVYIHEKDAADQQLQSLIKNVLDNYESFGYAFPDISSVTGHYIDSTFFQQRFVCYLTQRILQTDTLPSLETGTESFWPEQTLSQEERTTYLLPSCPWKDSYNPQINKPDCYSNEQTTDIVLKERIARLSFVVRILAEHALLNLQNQPNIPYTHMGFAKNHFYDAHHRIQRSQL